MWPLIIAAWIEEAFQLVLQSTGHEIWVRVQCSFVQLCIPIASGGGMGFKPVRGGGGLCLQKTTVIIHIVLIDIHMCAVRKNVRAPGQDRTRDLGSSVWRSPNWAISSETNACHREVYIWLLSSVIFEKTFEKCAPKVGSNLDRWIQSPKC